MLYLKRKDCTFAANLNDTYLVRKTTTYFLVLLYLIAMLKPIAPYIEYVVNYDYISKVLCINKDKPSMNCKGKCQLMKKIEQQQEDDFRSLRITMEEYPIGFVTILSLNENKDLYNKLTHNFNYTQHYNFEFYKDIFHPPSA